MLLSNVTEQFNKEFTQQFTQQYTQQCYSAVLLSSVTEERPQLPRYAGLVPYSCFGGEVGEEDFSPGGLLDNIMVTTAKTLAFLLSIY